MNILHWLRPASRKMNSYRFCHALIAGIVCYLARKKTKQNKNSNNKELNLLFTLVSFTLEANTEKIWVGYGQQMFLK